MVIWWTVTLVHKRMMGSDMFVTGHLPILLKMMIIWFHVVNQQANLSTANPSKELIIVRRLSMSRHHDFLIIVPCLRSTFQKLVAPSLAFLPQQKIDKLSNHKSLHILLKKVDSINALLWYRSVINSFIRKVNT